MRSRRTPSGPSRHRRKPAHGTAAAVLLLCLISLLVIASASEAFRLSGPSTNNNATTGPPLPPSSQPPFDHWDLREFLACTIPWAAHQGTEDIPGLAEFDEIDKAFQRWNDVMPAVINFSIAASAGAMCPLLFDGNNMLGWDEVGCTAPSDDTWDPGVAMAQRMCFGAVAANGTIIQAGPDGWLSEELNDCCDDTNGTSAGQLAVGSGDDGRIATVPAGDDQWHPAVPVAQRMCGGMVAANIVIIRDPVGGDGLITPANNCCDDRVAGGNVVDGGNALITTTLNNGTLGAGTLAVTATFDVPSSGKILESDILFNDRNYHWAIWAHNQNMGGQPDVWSIAMHEIGHMFGLHHPPGRLEANPPGPIMNPLFQLNANSNQLLNLDDIDAINFLYTPDLGDAPDPFIGNFNEYPSLVHGPNPSRTLNGLQLYAPAQGAEHLFGIVNRGSTVTPMGLTPSPTTSPTPTESPTLTATETPTLTETLTATPTVTATFTAGGGADTPTPTETASPTETETPTVTATPTTTARTPTPTLSPTPFAGATQSPFTGPTQTPFAGGRYQYEWLGKLPNGSIDDHPEECEARVPDMDAYDDGVEFGGIFIPGGGPVPVKITVRTARDVEGNAHCYALGNPMYLNAWFDWNADGDWQDPGEYVIGSLGGFEKVFGDGTYTFNVTAPVGALPGGYARFRLDWGEDVGQAHVATPVPTAATPTPPGASPTHTCPPTETPPFPFAPTSTAPLPTPFAKIDPTLDREKGAAQFGEVEDYPLQISQVRHYQCYEAHAPVAPLAPVSALDQFGPSVVTPQEPRRMCNPANKNGEDPSAPSDTEHLVGYRIKQNTPNFAEIRKTLPPLTIINQFGTIQVKLKKPDYLMVPSNKSTAGSPGPIVPTIDHYKCYRVKGARQRVPVQIDDQFGSMLLDVKRPLRLCAPVSKNGEVVFDSATHLMCYGARLTADPIEVFPRPGQVFINNQFGPDDFEVFRPTELCVPSVKIPG